MAQPHETSQLADPNLTNHERGTRQTRKYGLNQHLRRTHIRPQAVEGASFDRQLRELPPGLYHTGDAPIFVAPDMRKPKVEDSPRILGAEADENGIVHLTRDLTDAEVMANLRANLAKAEAEQQVEKPQLEYEILGEPKVKKLESAKKAKENKGKLAKAKDFAQQKARIALAVGMLAFGGGKVMEANATYAAPTPDHEAIPTLVLPEAGVAGAVTTHELPQNAKRISGNAWVGDAPVGFQGAVDRQIEIDTQHGINQQAALGLLKGEKGQTVYVKADDGSYIPVQVYERGVLHLWSDSDNMLNVVRKSTEADLFNGFFTVQAGNSVIASMDADTVAALARTPVVGDPNSSRTPTIPDLRKVSNYDGDISKLEQPKVGQNVKTVIEKGTNGAVIREANAGDNIPAPLLNVAYGEYTSGHNMPQIVRDFLNKNFNGQDVQQLGLPLTPYFLTPTRIDGQDTWVIMGIHERGRVTIRVDKNGQLLVEGGLSGNNWLAAINQGRTDINPNAPAPSESPNPTKEPHFPRSYRTSSRYTGETYFNGKLTNPGGWNEAGMGSTNGYNPSIDPDFAGKTGLNGRVISVDINNGFIIMNIGKGESRKVYLPDDIIGRLFVRDQYTGMSWNDAHKYGANIADLDPNDVITVVFNTYEEAIDRKSDGKAVGFIPIQ